MCVQKVNPELKGIGWSTISKDFFIPLEKLEKKWASQIITDFFGSRNYGWNQMKSYNVMFGWLTFHLILNIVGKSECVESLRFRRLSVFFVWIYFRQKAYIMNKLRIETKKFNLNHTLLQLPINNWPLAKVMFKITIFVLKSIFHAPFVNWKQTN